MVIVEDDPYGDLSYDGDPPPTLKSLDPEVIFLGTFSKVLAPGLRVGWVASSPRLREAFFNVKEGTDIHNERIMTRTVYHSARGFLDEHIAGDEGDLSRPPRCHAGWTRARRCQPACAGRRRTAGSFSGSRLPEQYETDAMLPDATDRGVIYLPSSWFYPDRSWTRSLRLNFSAQPEERIAEAMRSLAETIQAY